MKKIALEEFMKNPSKNDKSSGTIHNHDLIDTIMNSNKYKCFQLKSDQINLN